MKIAFFSAHPYEKDFLNEANEQYRYDLEFFENRLTLQTVNLAKNFKVVSCFVTDVLDEAVIFTLAAQGVRLIALRSAGFNNVDVEAARKAGVTVVRVPAYSPYAVAEFATAMILALNRKVYRAYMRVRENNFSLDGLLGFDLHGKTVGIIGTGKIGTVFCKIMQGFGVRLLGYDPVHNQQCKEYGLEYINLSELYAESDIVSLHCPLTPETKHMINVNALGLMKPGVILINTGRGGLLDTKAVIQALKTGKIGSLGMDVYEEEEDLFFQDLSLEIVQDDLFARLQTFPNVLITGHQAYFTQEALKNIAETTFDNIHAFEKDSLDDSVIVQ
jgi:D-lactate dehydrogenase